MTIGPFWKSFGTLAAGTFVAAPLASYLLNLAGAAVGVDLLLLVLFARALSLLVRAETAPHYNAMGVYFIFLSTYASGAMAYGVETHQIEGWEWILAVLDVTVVLVSTSAGTRCFYEAVLAKRAGK